MNLGKKIRSTYSRILSLRSLLSTVCVLRNSLLHVPRVILIPSKCFSAKTSV